MKDHPLEISHVSKIYKMDGIEFKALSDVSLTVKKGEFVAIMGPSGSGKSTLMHIIGCLDKPTQGNVSINGSDVLGMNEKQLAKIRNVNIGFVFQQYNLLRRTPAIANVELPLIYARVPRFKRRELARRELEAVGLKDKLYNLPSQLSGGQQQRVAIARALVTNPSILLADEPTGNLDSKSGKEIMEIIKNLHKQGRTIIMVTHDINVAQNAQRMVKMVDGRIVN